MGPGRQPALQTLHATYYPAIIPLESRVLTRLTGRQPFEHVPGDPCYRLVPGDELRPVRRRGREDRPAARARVDAHRRDVLALQIVPGRRCRAVERPDA